MLLSCLEGREAGCRKPRRSGERPDRGDEAPGIAHRRHACLLLDEPTAALDPEAGERIVALLRDLRARGLSVVMVTHVEAHARALGGTLYRCERGRLSVDA